MRAQCLSVAPHFYTNRDSSDLVFAKTVVRQTRASKTKPEGELRTGISYAVTLRQAQGERQDLDTLQIYSDDVGDPASKHWIPAYAGTTNNTEQVAFEVNEKLGAAMPPPQPSPWQGRE